MTYLERKPAMRREKELWEGTRRNALAVGDDATAALAEAELAALADEAHYWRMKAHGLEWTMREPTLAMRTE